jgi:hypothetical protein
MGRVRGRDVSEELTEALYLRVTKSDRAALDALASRIPALKSAAIARCAMRLGMAAIEKDPAVIFTGMAIRVGQ